MSNVRYEKFEALPAGDDTFELARFAARIPAGTPKAVVVLTPGSGGDGRWMVRDSFWTKFADAHKLALVGCNFTDRHPTNMAEQYVIASRGSGAALLSALCSFGLGATGLLMWGHSAGGQFNYEFACWHAPVEPGRILCFVVNKGGIYYTALAPIETRITPAVFFIGLKDAAYRRFILAGLYHMNIAVGAKWLVHYENLAHEVGASIKGSTALFERVLNGEVIE